MKKIFLTVLFLLIVLSLFAQEFTPEKIVSAKITGSQIEVTYIFPEGYHQSLQEDYFFIEVEILSDKQVSGLPSSSFEAPDWPK